MTLRKAAVGKFEGGLYIDQYVYEASLEGCDDEIGDVQEQGIWYGKIYRGTTTIYSMVQEQMKDDDEKLTSEEQEFLADVIGIIISEDDQGFISVDYYESDKKLKTDWDKIVKELTEEEEDDE